MQSGLNLCKDLYLEIQVGYTLGKSFGGIVYQKDDGVALTINIVNA